MVNPHCAFDAEVRLLRDSRRSILVGTWDTGGYFLSHRGTPSHPFLDGILSISDGGNT